MKINLMRKLDYWVGIPLCYFLTALRHISKGFSLGRKRTSAVRKILFIKLSEMGSIILSYPLLNKILIMHPDAKLFFLTFDKNKPVFEILGLSNQINVLTIREDSFGVFVLDTLSFLKRIRKEKIDLVFDLELFSRFSAILSYLSGSGKKVGFFRYTLEGLYRGNLLTHKFNYNPLLHISRSYLSLSDGLKLDNKSTPFLENKIDDKDIALPKFKVPFEIKQRLNNKLSMLGIKPNSRLILLNAGEGVIPEREWPFKNFIKLNQFLLKEDNNFIISVGTERAYGKAKLISDELKNSRCLDLTGKTSLVELMALFDLATLLILNDSGLVHLAALSPIKKFVFFGPESPQVYAPLGENTFLIYSHLACSPCLSAFNHRQSPCTQNRCLEIISPEEVYLRIKAVL